MALVSPQQCIISAVKENLALEGRKHSPHRWRMLENNLSTSEQSGIQSVRAGKTPAHRSPPKNSLSRTLTFCHSFCMWGGSSHWLLQAWVLRPTDAKAGWLLGDTGPPIRRVMPCSCLGPRTPLFWQNFLRTLLQPNTFSGRSSLPSLQEFNQHRGLRVHPGSSSPVFPLHWLCF